MIKKFLLIGTTATFLSFSYFSYADIRIYSNDENICSSIAGSWHGAGSVSNPLIGVCWYQGNGTISNVDAGGNFKLNLRAEKTSGSLICPQSPQAEYSGTCLNGSVRINTPYGNLNGNLSGSTGSASGTLTFSPGVFADVSVNFNR